MSVELAVALMVASVLAVAAVWIIVTRRSGRSTDLVEPPEPTVVWMRPRHAWFAHAFHRAELDAELPDVEPLAWCGRRPVGELVPVGDDAPHCVPCERAVERMEHRQE